VRYNDFRIQQRRRKAQVRIGLWRLLNFALVYFGVEWILKIGFCTFYTR